LFAEGAKFTGANLGYTLFHELLIDPMLWSIEHDYCANFSER